MRMNAVNQVSAGERKTGTGKLKVGSAGVPPADSRACSRHLKPGLR